MKIIPDAGLPLLPDETLMQPEPCLSSIPIKLEPNDALFPAPGVDIMSEAVPSPPAPSDDFGDFLLDAVDWL